MHNASLSALLKSHDTYKLVVDEAINKAMKRGTRALPSLFIIFYL